MNDCYILLIGKMRFIYYELKYIKKPHVLVLPDMWLFYYKYINYPPNEPLNPMRFQSKSPWWFSENLTRRPYHLYERMELKEIALLILNK